MSGRRRPRAGWPARVLVTRVLVTRGLAATLLAAGMSGARVAPAATVTEVERVCRAALAAGFRGVEAAACDWYTEPCAACGAPGAPGAEPAWCLPPSLSAAERARTVLAALAARPPRRDAPAEPLVKAILQRRYPCTAGDARD